MLRTESVGLLLQLVSTIFGVIMGSCAKKLGQLGVGPFFFILGSRLILLVAVSGVLLWQRVNPLRSQRKLLLLARGVLGFGVISTVFWSLQLLPMADATVLSRLSPIIIALLAPLLLHEPHSRGVWFALPPCLVGVVVMARPSFLFGGGSGGHSVGALAVGLSQSLVQAFTRISVRALGSTEPAASIIVSGAAVSALGSALFCAALPSQRVAPSSVLGWGLLGAMGLMACGLQATSTLALKKVRVAPAAAVNYASVVWALAADYLIFSHPPSLLSLLGAALVCGSTLGLMLFEGRQAAGSGSGSGGKAGWGRDPQKDGGQLAQNSESSEGNWTEDEMSEVEAQRLLGTQEYQQRSEGEQGPGQAREQELVQWGGGWDMQADSQRGQSRPQQQGAPPGQG